MEWHTSAKALVKNLGYTQTDLIPVLQVNTVAAVGHYLNGRRQPSPKQLKMLADFLGVTVDSFFAQPKIKDTVDQQLISRLQRKSGQQGDIRLRYGWSNPVGISNTVLVSKILKAGRFDDLLKAAKEFGISYLNQQAELINNLPQSTVQALKNIEIGFTQAKLQDVS